MKTLYILMILLIGCRGNSFKYLETNQKGKISPLMSYSIDDRDTLNEFVTELNLGEEYEEKLNYMLESGDEAKIDGKNILIKAAKEDDCNIMKAYHKYQKGLFDIRSLQYRDSTFELINTTIENRSIKCFEFIIDIIKNNSQTEYLNIDEMFNTILEGNVRSNYRYMELKKEYLAIKETRKNTVAIISDSKPTMNFNILTSIGLGIGYIGMGLSKNFENISTKGLLIVGGTILFTTPIYNYWKKFTKYKKEVTIKQEYIDNITARLDSKKSSLLEIVDETEKSELFMIDCLVNNLDINRNIIEKFKNVDKKKISEYLRNRLNNNREII